MLASMMVLVPSHVIALGHAAVRPGDRATPSQLLAELKDFNARLLASSSATQTLEAWCAEHHLAADPQIVAHLIDGPPKMASDEVRHHLSVGADEPVRYRHVTLSCGDHVLSVADNWYVPNRLTPEMNHQLETSDVPFGRVIKPLGATRHTLSALTLWHIPQGRHPALGQHQFSLPAHLLQHRAVLVTPQDLPIAEVVETYTSAIVDTDGAK